jgi:hypothetical protein
MFTENIMRLCFYKLMKEGCKKERQPEQPAISGPGPKQEQ